MKLAEHARCIVDQLARSRESDGRIPRLGAIALMVACGRKPSDYGKVFGQAISLLDAACINEDLPWLGRIVEFEKPANDFAGPWSSWAPYKPYILKAPLVRAWTDADLHRICAALLPNGPDKWWKEQEQHSGAWLQRALLVALRQAYDEPPVP